MFAGAWHQCVSPFAAHSLRAAPDPLEHPREFRGRFLAMIERHDMDVVRAFQGERIDIDWDGIKEDWKFKSRLY